MKDQKKSILVFETPSRCMMCPCYDDREGTCRTTLRPVSRVDALSKRSDYCTVKELPLRKMHESIIYVDNIQYERTNIFTEYDQGWNDCMDEITDQTPAWMKEENEEK